MDQCIGCHTCAFTVAYAILWLEVLLHYSAVKVFHIRCVTTGGRGRPTLPFFWKSKKCPGFGKKRPWFCPSWGWIYHSKYSFKSILGQKVPKFSAVKRTVLISRNLPFAKKFLLVCQHIYDISNLILFIRTVLTVSTEILVV